MSKASHLEAAFLIFLDQRAPDLPKPEREYQFHPERKWRLDFAWVEKKVAVEIEGLTRSGGRHQKRQGFLADAEKHEAALMLGWTVYRVPGSVGDGGRPLDVAGARHGSPAAPSGDGLMHVRLTQLDGKLPNIALMKLAHWHHARGDSVHFTRLPTPELWERPYDQVYASAIFEWTAPVIERLRAAWPDAIVGGTGSGSWRTVEELIGEPEYERYDYSIYPDFPHSIGFTQRGCRLKCPFCVVPKKEGKAKAVNSIEDLWRPGTPRCVLLLDNDFFGVPEWPDRIREIRDGGFRVSFSQGINIRMVTPEVAEALASIKYRDDGFTQSRLYTAWDNAKDERRFFAGVKMLNEAGVPSKHLMVYMLVGYWEGETLDDVFYRYERLKAIGCKPYPMVYEKWRQPELRKFARWVIGRYDQIVPWEKYQKRDEDSSVDVPDGAPQLALPL